MFRRITIAAIAAVLGFGSLAAMPASAQASGIYFSFGNDGPRGGMHFRGPDSFGKRHYRPRPSACTPREALSKAHRLGLRHVRIADVDRRTIRVYGQRHRQRAAIVFARAPRCPVIAVR